jgi:putative aldouronate transport system substrate-binding protein
MKLKKTLSIMLSTVLLCIIAVACSNAGNSTSNNLNVNNSTNVSNDAGSDTDDMAEQIQAGTYRFDPPVTLTTALSTNNTIIFKDGDTMENNFWTKYLKDKMGIDQKAVWSVPDDQYETKIRLILSSGQKLPDVVKANGALLNDLIETGQFIDLSEAFEQYASPQLKTALADEASWTQVLNGGKKMGIPLTMPGQNNNSLMYIRQDWLDKLGMQPPTTMEELDTLLQAMKDNAAMLGTKDLVPLGISLKSGLGGWFGESTWAFGPSGTIPGYWMKKDDGTLEYGSATSKMKGGLGLLADWYKRGIISKEAALHDESKVAELVAKGDIGVVFAPNWSTGWPIPDLKNNVPGADMLPHPLPTQNGKALAFDTEYLVGALLIHKDANVPAFFAYWNKINEYITTSDENSEFYANKGIKEGVDYITRADGTYSRDSADFTDGQRADAKKFAFAQGTPNPYGTQQIALDLVNGKSPETPDEIAMSKSSQEYLEAVALVWEHRDDYIMNEFRQPPTETMVKNGTVLNKMETEAITKIIYGKSPVDSIDDFIQQWLKGGGDKITAEVNEAYKKSNGQ